MAAIVVSGCLVEPAFAFGPDSISAIPPCDLASMSGWTLGFVLANQVALVVVRNLADPGSSRASAYFDAFTFFVLPHGLLAVSVATTFNRVGRGRGRDPDAFAERFTTGLRAITSLTARQLRSSSCFGNP